jgi:hypothetical protein
MNFIVCRGGGEAFVVYGKPIMIGSQIDFLLTGSGGLQMRKKQISILTLATLFAVFASISIAYSYDLTFTSGGYYRDYLGWDGSVDNPSHYDILNIVGVTSTVSLSLDVPTNVEINDLNFITGPNNYGFNVNYGPYDATRTLTIGGITQQISNPYSVNIANYDTLTLTAGTVVTFHFFDGYSLDVTPIGGPFYDNSSNPNSPVFAEFTLHYDSNSVQSVPEPATMLLLGFGLLGLAASKRKINRE